MRKALKLLFLKNFELSIIYKGNSYIWIFCRLKGYTKSFSILKKGINTGIFNQVEDDNRNNNVNAPGVFRIKFENK